MSAGHLCKWTKTDNDDDDDKDIRLDWLTVMFDDFLHQLVSGSLPSYGWRFSVDNKQTEMRLLMSIM